MSNVNTCSGKSWHAVLTRPRAEKTTAAEICARGLECYLPLVREVHAWSDRRQPVDTPLFPGYLFVRLSSAAEEQLAVQRVSTVARLLGHNNQPEVIPDIEIESVRRVIASGIDFHRINMLRAGDRVLVRRGPLRGVEGFFERFGRRGRLVVNIEMLARGLQVEVDSGDVRTALGCAVRLN